MTAGCRFNTAPAGSDRPGGTLDSRSAVFRSTRRLRRRERSFSRPAGRRARDLQIASGCRRPWAQSPVGWSRPPATERSSQGFHGLRSPLLTALLLVASLLSTVFSCFGMLLATYSNRESLPRKPFGRSARAILCFFSPNRLSILSRLPLFYFNTPKRKRQAFRTAKWFFIFCVVFALRACEFTARFLFFSVFYFLGTFSDQINIASHMIFMQLSIFLFSLRQLFLALKKCISRRFELSFQQSEGYWNQTDFQLIAVNFFNKFRCITAKACMRRSGGTLDLV